LTPVAIKVCAPRTRPFSRTLSAKRVGGDEKLYRRWLLDKESDIPIDVETAFHRLRRHRSPGS
jgi:hypothetical protein